MADQCLIMLLYLFVNLKCFDIIYTQAVFPSVILWLALLAPVFILETCYIPLNFENCGKL
jgi:hypothetical protein